MDALEQQKIKVMIELATQQFRSEIDSLKNKIKGFETEISSLRGQLMQARSFQQSTTQQDPVYEERQEPQKRFQTQPQEKEPARSPIDRNGVAPADVSIEKMFYFGNKRF